MIGREPAAIRYHEDPDLFREAVVGLLVGTVGGPGPPPVGAGGRARPGGRRLGRLPARRGAGAARRRAGESVAGRARPGAAPHRRQRQRPRTRRRLPADALRSPWRRGPPGRRPRGLDRRPPGGRDPPPAPPRPVAAPCPPAFAGVM